MNSPFSDFPPYDAQRAVERRKQLFEFVLPSDCAAVYYFTDESGLCSGPAPANEYIRFVFLVNMASDCSTSFTGTWTCNAFFLDAEPTSRPSRTRHFQLVHEPEADGLDFARWAGMVMRYLSGFHLGAQMPAADCHDLATVLEAVANPRLKFTLIRPVDEYEIVSALSTIPDYTNLLAMFYGPVGRFCPVSSMGEIFDLHHSQDGWFKFAGGIHLDEDCAVMLLGEPVESRDS
ncbi:hypothetical protein [Pseudomonas rossensis]|uniref:hypothetical protein n=1 Tax=Pseudomonas rossensis TaxID=2305471 RepID=UPI0032606BB1